ncbi:MAG: hypothetical protein MHMPM18_000626 [Marteilia pararefringens]
MSCTKRIFIFAIVFGSLDCTSNGSEQMQEEQMKEEQNQDKIIFIEYLGSKLCFECISSPQKCSRECTIEYPSAMPEIKLRGDELKSEIVDYWDCNKSCDYCNEFWNGGGLVKC